MKNKSKIGLGLILIGILAIVCFKGMIETPTSDTPSTSSVKVELSISPFSEEKISELTVTITSAIDAQNITAQLNLSEGIELLSGSQQWSCDIPANGSVHFKAKIKAVRTGDWTVEANTRYMAPRTQDLFEDSDKLYLTVCDEVTISDAPPVNNWYEQAQTRTIPLQQNNGMIESDLFFSSLPELNEEVTLIYTLTPQINLSDSQKTQIIINYPKKGFEIIDVEFPPETEIYEDEGQLTWRGSIESNQTVQIKAVVRAISTGNGFIYAHLSVQPHGEITELISDVQVLDVKVGECYASVENRKSSSKTALNDIFSEPNDKIEPPSFPG